MPVEKIVMNASPLILLCNSELSWILPELFLDTVVPDAVWQEIVNGPHSDHAAHRLPGLDWLRKVIVPPVPEIMRWDLGDGETAVLSFALKQRTYTPVLDDLAAKKSPSRLGFRLWEQVRS